MSSVFLKILDWVIFIFFGEILGLDSLQFAYQEKCSTTMCTWGVIETVGYFLRNGSVDFTFMMDMMKVFYIARYSVLFIKFISIGLSTIFIGIVFFIYVFQYNNVHWDVEFSDIFGVSNSVCQGAVSSGILYCFYVNNLFSTLRDRGSRCWIEGSYQGILGYSDDNFFIAPLEESLQDMLITCEQYAKQHNLKFSTNPLPKMCKTKCIAYQRKKGPLKTMYLNGNPLPWVSDGLHSGNNLTNWYDGLRSDMKIKRGMYISKSCELQQEFYFCHPENLLKLNAIYIYNSHFTDSPLWDLFSKEAIQIANTWNVSIRHIFSLPFQTHRYLIEPISSLPQIKKTLLKRFLSFIKQIRTSPKATLRSLFRIIENDTRSITGSNLNYLMLGCGKTNIYQLNITDAHSIKYHQISEESQWKVD